MALAQFQAFFSQISANITSVNTGLCVNTPIQFFGNITGEATGYSDNMSFDADDASQYPAPSYTYTDQTANLVCGQAYRLTISGVYSNWNTCGGELNCTQKMSCTNFRFADAAYRYIADFATSGIQGEMITNNNQLNRITGAYDTIVPNEITNQDANNNIYTYDFLAQNAPLAISFSDGTAGTSFVDNCGGLNYNLIAVSNQYQWDFGDNTGLLTGTNANPSHTYTNAGTYTVTLTINPQINSVNNFANCPLTFTTTVTINSLPTVNIVGNISICPGTATSLTASGALNYQWFTGFDNLGTTNPISVTPSESPTTYRVIGTDANGCRNLASHTITLLAPPNIIVTPSTTVICSQSSNNVTLTASGGSSYFWTNGTINLGTGSSILVTVLPQQTAILSVSSTGTNGCVGSATATIINNKPTIGIVATPPSVCQGSTVSLSAVNQTQGSSLLWSTGQITTNITVTLFNNAVYTLTATKDGCSNSASRSIEVYPLPNVTISGSSTVCEGSAISLTGITNGDSYKWYNTNNLTTVLSTSQIFSPIPIVSPTTYQLTVVDGNGCSNSTTKTITFENDCNCGIPLGVNGNISGGIFSNAVYRIDNDVTLTGIVNLINVEIKVAPGKKIILNPNAQLIIKGAHFYACTDMWQGIEMKSDSKIKIDDYVSGSLTKSSLIEDAIIAINLDPLLNSVPSLSQVFLNNVTFNRNRTAVKIVNQNRAQFFGQSKIENCVFTSRNLPKQLFVSNMMTWTRTSDLRVATNPFPGNPHTEQYISQVSYPYTTLKNPNSTIFPENCLIFENIKDGDNLFKIGSVTNFNIFDKAGTHIDVKNSNVEIRGNFFQNTVNSSFSTGYGVKGFENRASLAAFQNAMNIWSNQFVNCHNAVFVTNYYKLSISLNTIRSNQNFSVYNTTHPGSVGISVLGYKFDYNDINRNYLYNIKSGIIFSGSYFPQNSSVVVQDYNRISIQGNHVKRNMEGYTTDCYVADAIKVNNSIPSGSSANFGQTVDFNITIKANILENVFRGVQCNTWKANKSIYIGEHEISLTQNSISGGQYYGIDFNDNLIAPGLNNKIFDNTITGFSSALAGWTMPAIKLENTQGANVICNTLSSTKYGLYFSHTNPNTNTILNSMNNHAYGFVLDNSGLISQQGNNSRRTGNKFTGFTGTKRKTACLNGSNATQSKMYVKNVDSENPNGSSIAINNSTPYSNPTNILYTSASPGVCEQYQSPQQPNNQLLEEQRESMRRIINHEDVFEPNPIESEHIAKEQIYTVLKMNPHLMENEAVLQAFFAQEEQGNNGKLKRTLDFIENGQLLDAQNEINAMSITHPIDYNNQRFYDIYLNYLNDSLDVVDSLDLITLGNKCPHLDGSIVFQARSLYGLKYGYDYLFAPTCDTEITDTIEIQGMMISSEDNGTEFLNLAKELDVLLYPNPSKTSINLTAENIASFQLTIIDQQGRIIPFEKEIKHQNLVQIQHTLDKGFYTILIDDGHQKLSKKLFIE